MVFRLDADQNGIGSIRRAVSEGLVTNIPCPNLAAYETACEELLQGKAKAGDTVILDTLSMMMTTVLGELKLGSEAKPLGPAIRRLMANDDRGSAYKDSAQSIMRWLRFLRNQEINIITLSHEKEIIDQMTGLRKYGPNHNADLYSSLNASSSDMFRLKVLLEDEVDEEGRVVRPAFSRVLQLRPDAESMAKYHTDFGDEAGMPRELSNPTLPRLYKAIKGRPEWLAIYGAPGVGKTTFACSEVLTTTKEKNA